MFRVAERNVFEMRKEDFHGSITLAYEKKYDPLSVLDSQARARKKIK